jgi:hypothetical protein
LVNVQILRGYGGDILNIFEPSYCVFNGNLLPIQKALF